MSSYFVVGWSVLHLCHHAWCLQTFLSMKHPSFEPTHSFPLQRFSLMCVTSLCASIQECFRQAFFPLRCLCSYQSSQKMQASETLFGLSEVVWTSCFLVITLSLRLLSQVCALRKYNAVMCPVAGWWTGHDMTLLSQTSKRKVEVACHYFCCLQDIVTSPLSFYFVHARSFSHSVSLKHAHKYSVCGPLLCVRISRSLSL